MVVWTRFWLSAVCLKGGLDVDGVGAVLGRQGIPNTDGFGCF